MPSHDVNPRHRRALLQRRPVFPYATMAWRSIFAGRGVLRVRARGRCGFWFCCGLIWRRVFGGSLAGDQVRQRYAYTLGAHVCLRLRARTGEQQRGNGGDQTGEHGAESLARIGQWEALRTAPGARCALFLLVAVLALPQRRAQVRRGRAKRKTATDRARRQRAAEDWTKPQDATRAQLQRAGRSPRVGFGFRLARWR